MQELPLVIRRSSRQKEAEPALGACVGRGGAAPHRQLMGLPGKVEKFSFTGRQAKLLQAWRG